MKLFYNNTITIKTVNNLVQHNQTKHTKRKNYINDNLNFDVIKVSYIKMMDQLANMMTWGSYIIIQVGHG